MPKKAEYPISATELERKTRKEIQRNIYEEKAIEQARDAEGNVVQVGHDYIVNFLVAKRIVWAKRCDKYPDLDFLKKQFMNEIKYGEPGEKLAAHIEEEENERELKIAEHSEEIKRKAKEQQARLQNTIIK